MEKYEEDREEGEVRGKRRGRRRRRILLLVSVITGFCEKGTLRNILFIMGWQLLPVKYRINKYFPVYDDSFICT